MLPTSPDTDPDRNAPITRPIPYRPTADRPVFVDPSGRRRRVVRLLAMVASGVVAGYGGLLAVAVLAGSPAPSALLPLPAVPIAGPSATSPPLAPVVPRAAPRPPTMTAPAGPAAARPVAGEVPGSRTSSAVGGAAPVGSAVATTSAPPATTSWTPPGQVGKTRSTGPGHGP